MKLTRNFFCRRTFDTVCFGKFSDGSFDSSCSEHVGPVREEFTEQFYSTSSYHPRRIHVFRKWILDTPGLYVADNNALPSRPHCLLYLILTIQYVGTQMNFICRMNYFAMCSSPIIFSIILYTLSFSNCLTRDKEDFDDEKVPRLCLGRRFLDLDIQLFILSTSSEVSYKTGVCVKR